MQPVPKEMRAELVRTELGRAVIIPEDFILEGREIILRQERDGLITGTAEGLEVMRRRFDPFGDEYDCAVSFNSSLS